MTQPAVCPRLGHMTRLLKARGDVLLALALGVAAELEISLRGVPHLPVLLVLGVLAPASLAWRVRAPVVVVVVNVLAALAIELLSGPDDSPVALGIVLLVAVYSAAAHTEGRAKEAA